MKKLIVVALMFVMLFTLIFSGCSSEVKAYTDAGQVINTGVNQEFIIALESNVTTGYSWQPRHHKTKPRLS
jgi:inhibitor of cysteine peptidase